MKRITRIIILLILSIILIGCTNNTKKEELKIIVDSLTVSQGGELFISVDSTTIGNYIYESSDESIASVDEFGFLSANKVGTVTITVYLESDPSLIDSVEITVTDMTLSNIKVNGSTMGHVNDELNLTYIQYPRGINETLTFESSDESVASINNNGKIKLNKIGFSKITVTSESGYKHTFNVGAFDFSKIVVDSEKEAEDGEKITVENVDYYYNYTYVKEIKNATDNIDENGTIYVMSGTYQKDFIISKKGIKLLGINYNINPVTSNWEKEAKILNACVINADLDDIQIKGLTFTDGAYISIYGNNNNLVIANNKFIDSNLACSWSKISSTSMIFFKNNVDNSDNVTITQNVFKNIKSYCITLSYILNLKITNNLFEDYKLDAIKSNLNETLNSCQWLIRNNSFKNGGYNGIYFASFGPKVVSYEALISIFDNTFENIGNDIDTIFNHAYGAISLETYNGGTTSVVSRYNTFINCKSVMRVDNTQNEIYFNNLNVYANNNLIKIGDVCDYLFVSFKEVNNSTGKTSINPNFINACDNIYLDLSNNEKDVSSYNLSDTSKTITLDYFNNSTKIYANNVVHIEQNGKILSDDEGLTYTSSDQSILKVLNDGSLTAIKEGTCKVTAYKNGNIAGSISFIVKPSINIDYASLLVSRALKEEGYIEGSNNYTKYGVWYASIVSDKSFENGAWCAMFVSWCANQVNIPNTIIPLYASVAAGRQWFESRGLFHYKENYTPKTGDLIFFLSNGASHTGIVVKYANGTVYTIEGNTSNMCAQRSYSPDNARITGYGSPNYPVYNGKPADFDISSSTSGDGHSTH